MQIEDEFLILDNTSSPPLLIWFILYKGRNFFHGWATTKTVGNLLLDLPHKSGLCTSDGSISTATYILSVYAFLKIYFTLTKLYYV
jgi:hypothetical protein